MEPYYDLGSHTRPVGAATEQAQVWFDRGLVWCYAFHHDEAVRCFERALESDPDLAAARWGIAYAIGPDYNQPWSAFGEADRRDAVARARRELALAATGRADDVTRGLLDALGRRFAVDPAGELDAFDAAAHAYADAMVALAAEHPGDLDVAALAVDALVNLTPWSLWEAGSDSPTPGSRVVEAVTLLDAALATDGGAVHPGLLHLHIHTMEMSEHPETAMRSADRLRGLVPDAGHLQHMPSHIDVLCGDYHASVVANTAAVVADRRYVQRAGAVNAYSLYRAHDLHFIVYSAMFCGARRRALDAAAELEAQLTPELLTVTSPPMADWLEAFAPLRTHVHIRFGEWDELLAAPLPEDRALYATTVATAHYGRGIARAALGDPRRARTERDAFAAAYARVPETRTLFNNTARDILGIAEAMLDGEIAYREGRHDEAFALLTEAVRRDDSLPYDEPWGWMQPTRHALGALLLEQGRVDDAVEVYAADLGLDPSLPRRCQHPGNVWSLHGYHECLTRLGRHDEAAIIARQLTLARARADVEVRASCACRLDADEPCRP